MKKFFATFSLVVMLLSLTGCMKFNATMDIKEDKSMDFSIIYAMSKNLLEMSDDSETVMSEEEKNQIIEKGFEVSDYEDSDFKGFKLIKKITNIDDFSSETDNVSYSISGIFESESDDKIFKVVKGDKKNTYIANFVFDSNDSTLSTDTEDSEDDEEDIDDEEIENEITIEENDVITDDDDTEGSTDLNGLGEEFAKTMDLKFLVKLPYKPLSSNASETSDDGKELIWNLSTTDSQEIKFEFELNNKSDSGNFFQNIVSNFKFDVPTITAIISFLMGIISLILAIIYHNKKKNNQNTI